MQHILTSLKRITKTGVSNFIRNGWLSTATVSILTITLFVVLFLLMMSVLTESVIINLQNRVDVSVYLKKDTKESDILKMQNDLIALSEVKSVDYVSEDDALMEFREKHKDNEIIIQSLDVLEENPLEASLNIKAKDPSQFKTIVEFLESGQYKDIISKINYYENQEIIEKIGVLISSIRKIGFTISIALTIVAFLVAFNTIRITIYTMKDEIGIMKLVGATNWFVRGPFVVEGFLYGFVSSLVTVILAFPVLYFSSPFIKKYFYDIDMFAYFQENLVIIWIILLVVGVVIGALGSIIAMQRYLKI